jgi:ABC-type uncharacterized transport system fused permease/ATPase subunit
MELLLPGPALLILFAVIATVILACWFIALKDVLTSRFPGPNDRLLWSLLIFFAPFVGTLLYFLIGRRTRLNNHR